MTRQPSSSGTESAHYLSAIRLRLERLYDASADNPRLREQLSDEVDWIDAQIGHSRAPAQQPFSGIAAVLRKHLKIGGHDAWEGHYYRVDGIEAAANELAGTLGNAQQPGKCLECGWNGGV